MATVTVHNYLIWDRQNGRSVIPAMKITVERIGLIGGKIVPGTGEDVDVSALDAKGRYLPDVASAGQG
jgi:hypothetical protein